MRTLGLIGIIYWTGIIAIIGDSIAPTRIETICGKKEERYTPLFALIAVLPIIFWAGLRGGAGYTDTNAYIKFYSIVPDSPVELREYIANINGNDPGFTLLTALIKRVFGSSYTPYLFIIASIQCYIVTMFFRKYSADYCLSFFLFIASVEYYGWIFNGMRQFLAVVITLAGFRFLLEKKYIYYIFIVLIASSIHLSAIIMIPVAFIVQGKPWNRKTMIIIMVAIFALLFTNRFTNILELTMHNTQYGESVGSWDDNGTNPIRVLFNSIPTIFAFLTKDTIMEKNNPLIDVCVNMSIVSTGIWIVSMVTSGIYIGRLPIYVNLFNYILYPYLLEDCISDKRQSQIIWLVIVVTYLLFYYYQVHITWRLF